jgi:hypothetical protein
MYAYIVPVGQGQRKIILKLNAEILGKLVFQKNKILGKNNIGEYSRNKHLPNLIFPNFFLSGTHVTTLPYW